MDVNLWDRILIDSNKIKYGAENDLNDEANAYLKFDAISCLNLLDRCETPLTYLKKIKNALVKDGLLIIALVLPFKSYVEYNNNNKPREMLFDFTALKNTTITDQTKIANNGVCEISSNSCQKINKVNKQISYLVENVFEPLGFELLKFTRLPYLCEGNLAQSYYFMYDYIFIFRSK